IWRSSQHSGKAPKRRGPRPVRAGAAESGVGTGSAEPLHARGSPGSDFHVESKEEPRKTPMSEPKLISIVTPCFNEEENVEPLARKVQEIFAGLPQYRFEHIFIDNAS